MPQIEMTVVGSAVTPLHISENIDSTLDAISLRIVATPPCDRTVGLWNLKLEYQTSNLLPWKRVDRVSISTSATVGKNSAYPSIQSAIDGIGSGGVVVVHPGHYNEDIRINKPLRLLMAGDGHKAILFGQLHIESSNVTVDGFQFHTTRRFKPSVTIVNSTFVSVQNCEFHGSKEVKFSTQSQHHRTSSLYLQNSVNVQVINSIFKDSAVGITINNCTGCGIRGSSFTSCFSAVQSFLSESINVARNYFSRNLAALEVDNLEYFSHVLDENVFEKNSAIAKTNGKLFSRSELEEIIGCSSVCGTKTKFEQPEVSQTVLIYGSCEAELGSEPHPRSHDQCIYIKGEFNYSLLSVLDDLRFDENIYYSTI